ncbi:methionine--tRNA ligase [Candidatus Saccharibacteria bacterium]|nr:methionine--tRNA ligase [Candidatus Saccharibacteria bacterium]MBI3338257.1 methionine--tRNA ligase [Candidatus Saccharibacteria bacterium]
MNYFVTTSIPYVNGDPHLGHAMELVMADVIARCARQQNKSVIFSTGTDEHGGKMAEKAQELNLTEKAFTDQMSQKFRDLAKDLNISNDRFIRTTDAGHEQRAQIIWKNLEKDIFKSTYTGWYCTGDEAFFTEATVKENKGICPNHNRAYEQVKEENYFFKLTKYTDQIKNAIDSGAFRIIPATRKHEIQQILKDGLEDISISRPKGKISWGIPVPGDDTQVMYVWFEALMNYITVLGYPEHEDFQKFWPANVQVVGKDITRFHAAIWPGMLLGLGLPLPRVLYIHGFINIDGKKMSKSLGNYISPTEIIEKYSADVLRYYLLRHVSSYGDGDFSWKKLNEAYNNELANELGNAVQRTASMVTQYQNGIIGNILPPEHDIAQYNEALESCHFDRALDEIWEQVRGLNQYIDEQKPWAINKTGDKEHLQEILAYQASCLLEIAELLNPFMPETALKICHVFEEGVVHPIENTLFPRKDSSDTQSIAVPRQNDQILNNG